ncbi:MAG: hypothetical protein K5765_06210 [Clostridia bacterium]|nr:hypothetical protein [Clostridia bacterium]
MKKSIKKLIGVLVVCVLLISLIASLAACSKKQAKDTIVVAYPNFSEKFSPFFATSAYDVDVYSMTQVNLLATDRGGNIIYQGINGETVKYNGTDYTYYGLSDIEVVTNDDGTVDYNITMRTGDKAITFSDGETVTVKDVIFSMYVLSDTDYDGSSTFYSLPIKGMQEWRTQLSTSVLAEYQAKVNAILATYQEVEDEDEDGNPVYVTERVYGAEYDEKGEFVKKVPVVDANGKKIYRNKLDENEQPIISTHMEYVYAENDVFTKAEFDSFMEMIDSVESDGAWQELAKDIVNYCAEEYASYLAGFGNNEVANGMGLWGFGDFGEVETDEDGNPKYYDVKDEDGNVVTADETTYVVKTDEGGNYLYDENGYLQYTEEVEEDVVQKETKTINEDKFFDSTGKGYTLTGTSFPTLKDYAVALKDAYGDFADAAGVEAANGDYDSYIANVAEKWMAKAGASKMAGQTINSIEGITYNETNGTIKVTTSKYSATTIYQLAIAVAPLHYYGEVSKFNPTNGSYGFTRGDLTKIREKTTTPLGAGPYKFVDYKDGIVTFEANTNFWLGAPKTKYLKFKEYSKDEDKIPAMLAGDVDIATPSISEEVVKQINDANGGNKSLKVDKDLKISTDLVDYNGYGYIGMNADNIKVGTNKASEESKNLRKAFATLFAAYREYTVNTYYQDRASVIQYPITNCSWAAPQPADQGYTQAFSVNVDDEAIYTANMTDEQKYAAAKEAAIGFFKAAGYTWDAQNNKFTAAPDGAKLEYEAIIGADGTGNHPTFALLTKCAEVLEGIGIKLEVTDISNSSVLFARMEEGTAEIFCAAWGGSVDPDMYQVYNSENNTGSNHYRIADAQLDSLIDQARSSTDKTARKSMYKQCLDIILDWAVEIPVYQRKDCTVYSNTINVESLTPDTTPFWSYLMEIEKVEVK